MAVRLSRAERREQTRQELLSAAEACFVSRGFHASSVDEVAERAGYTKGAVYSNFAAKEDLFFAVYERRVEQVLTEVVPGLRQAGAAQAFDWRCHAQPSSVATATRAGWRCSLSSGPMCCAIPSSATASPPSTPASWSRWPRRCEQLAEDRGLALPSDVTASQVALAWNAMELGLGLERLTQPQAVDVVLARRMGWLLLDAVLDGAQPPAGNDGTQQDRRIR